MNELAIEIERAVRRYRYTDDTRAFHRDVMSALFADGWVCRREFPASCLFDGVPLNGRIDVLAARSGALAALECDRRNPRQKSLQKLLATDCDVRLVVLRRLVPLHEVQGVAVFGVEVAS